MRRADYLAVGGMDAVDFKVLFNDVDICLKLRDVGKRVLWTPYATLIHFGSTSLRPGPGQLRKLAESNERADSERRALYRHWMPQLARDPFYNSNLSLAKRDFSLDTYFPFSWSAEFKDRPRVLALPLLGGSGIYRAREPIGALSDAGRVQGESVALQEGALRYPMVTELARKRPDTVLIHAGLDDQVLGFLEYCRELFPEVFNVYALDDLIAQIPVKSSVFRIFKGLFRDARPRLRRALKSCDRLIVSTQPLADSCEGLIEDIVVAPTDCRPFGTACHRAVTLAVSPVSAGSGHSSIRVISS
jgi:hypothetical protein